MASPGRVTKHISLMRRTVSLSSISTVNVCCCNVLSVILIVILEMFQGIKLYNQSIEASKGRGDSSKFCSGDIKWRHGHGRGGVIPHKNFRSYNRRDQPTSAHNLFKTADNPVILILFIILYPFLTDLILFHTLQVVQLYTCGSINFLQLCKAENWRTIVKTNEDSLKIRVFYFIFDNRAESIFNDFSSPFDEK
jgi:hypothetical protein